MQLRDYNFPSEWPGFAYSCFDVKRRKPVMAIVEAQDVGYYVYVGELPFPEDSHGWTGMKPLTKMAREMRKAQP